MYKAELETIDGWIEFNPNERDPEEFNCACGDEAEEFTFIGNSPQDYGVALYWPQCAGCAEESRCQSRDGQRRSESEMDYYAGFE